MADHSVPFGDFGDGAYLSDNYEESLIWGAVGEPGIAVLNEYEISDDIYNLNGIELDPDIDGDMMFWVISVCYPRRYKLRSLIERGSFQGDAVALIEQLYQEYVEPFIADYDWIISSRSDDGTTFFLPDFIRGDEGLDVVKYVYQYLSFGKQLVLKTTKATNCLTFISAESYNKSQYSGEYDQWIINNTRQYQNLRGKI